MTQPPPPPPVATGCLHQYAAKMVCGVINCAREDNPLPLGQYFTAVNVHNPSRCKTVQFRWKAAQALPVDRVPGGLVSGFRERSLGPDEAVEIDCPNIMRALSGPTGAPLFAKGWVVIESRDELDVVAVYGTAAGVGGAVNTFHTERVPQRCLACIDLRLVLDTGFPTVAAWQQAPGDLHMLPPTAPGFTPAAPVVGQPGQWGTRSPALWRGFGGDDQQCCSCSERSTAPRGRQSEEKIRRERRKDGPERC